jgi:hypothetical protein
MEKNYSQGKNHQQHVNVTVGNPMEKNYSQGKNHQQHVNLKVANPMEKITAKERITSSMSISK